MCDITITHTNKHDNDSNTFSEVTVCQAQGQDSASSPLPLAANPTTPSHAHPFLDRETETQGGEAVIQGHPACRWQSQDPTRLTGLRWLYCLTPWDLGKRSGGIRSCHAHSPGGWEGVSPMST